MMRPWARPWEMVPSRLRLPALVVLLCAVALAGSVLWGAHDDDGAEVVGRSSQAGWTTIQFRGVRVDVPPSWERVDTDDCEFEFEVWAAPGSRSCTGTGGLSFYQAANFDPGPAPGVHRTSSEGGPEWGGYAYAGELALYVSDDDRFTVLRVLGSAR